MRRKNGRTLEVTNVWLIAGLLFTAIAAGLIRFMAILVIGKESALSPVGNMGIVFDLALPIIVATGVCLILRSIAIVKERRSSESKAELSSLMISAADGDLGRVKELVASGADINARSRSGTTALMLAVRNEHLATVRFLVSAGANVNAASTKGTAAISIAQSIGNAELLECLMENRAG